VTDTYPSYDNHFVTISATGFYLIEVAVLRGEARAVRVGEKVKILLALNCLTVLYVPVRVASF
jgi:hypothetical protein